MRKCPSCGFNNPETRERCLRCSTMLVTVALPDGSHVADRRPLPFHPVVLARRAEQWLSDKFSGGELPTGLSHRYYWTAAYLSLIPGGGQLYNHQPFKAAVFIAIWTALAALFVVSLFQPWNNWVALGFAFWLFYVMGDGFVTANRINGAYWSWKQLLAVWFAFMFFIGVALAAGQFAGMAGLFRLVTVRQDFLAPGFERGDKVFVLMPGIAKTPQRGSVVLYAPESYAVHRFGGLTTDIYSVRPRNTFGVVTGVRGDVIRCDDDGIIRLNGEPVTPNLLPVYPNGVPYRIELAIRDHDFAILSSTPVDDYTILAALGPAFGSDVPSPRAVALAPNLGLFDWDKSSLANRDQIRGVALFRYFPPERRQWFGWNGGLYEEPPDGYPQPR